MDRERLLSHSFPEIVRDYDDAFTMLYALSIGIGADPMDERQLAFVTEPGLTAFPTMAVVLATPGFWAQDPQFSIDWKRVLHGEQALVLHGQLPASGSVSGALRVTDIDDKGPGKGAIIHSERTLTNQANGQLVATLRQTTFARGDGGCGGTEAPQAEVWVRPDQPPDGVCDMSTSPNSALLYRLTGDRNPLHSTPAVARAGGFDRPILHGLCTFGVIAHSLVATCAEYDASRLTALEGRFSSPVIPGERITTSIWAHGDDLLFETTASGGRLVFTRGRARVSS